MRFARGDVRDHIVLAKIDHRPSYRRYSALQRRESPKINFREIFEVVRYDRGNPRPQPGPAGGRDTLR
jgi:hypothetical protein